jgi:hypothetical protein
LFAEGRTFTLEEFKHGLKAGGERQRLRVAHFRSFPNVMRDEGSKVG